MADVDLNLLPALDALLAEGSVAGAARRLGLSESAMSRTLSRLRAATGDPLLVRAGRGMAPTPYADELRDRAREAAHEARAILRPAAAPLDLAALERAFTIRASEGFVEAFAARLVASATAASPHVRLHFAPKPDKDVRSLREGLVDLEIGVIGKSAPEIRVQTLYRDRFVGVVREGHPLTAAGDVTPALYAACAHVVASRRADGRGPVDEALAALGLARSVVVVVPGFPAALAVARTSDLVALAPKSFFTALQERQAEPAALGLRSFALPVATPEITVSQMWHPRMDADPALRWLRGVVSAACRQVGQ